MSSWEEMEKGELKLDEGLRLTAYKDSLGNWTIGYGHLMRMPYDVGGDPTTITLQEAEDLFETDFEEAISDAQSAVPFFNALDGPRKGALVNMAFQLGATKLSGFHGTLAAMDEQDWNGAAKNVMNSLYARQARARATRIAYRIRTGEYSVRT